MTIQEHMQGNHLGNCHLQQKNLCLELSIYNQNSTEQLNQSQEKPSSYYELIKGYKNTNTEVDFTINHFHPRQSFLIIIIILIM